MGVLKKCYMCYMKKTYRVKDETCEGLDISSLGISAMANAAMILAALLLSHSYSSPWLPKGLPRGLLRDTVIHIAHAHWD